MTSSYSQKLLDPRWQRKRLEILNRDGFACLMCGDKTNTLHVHHGFYEKGGDPWDYPNNSLHTLCAACHEDVTITMAEIYRSIGVLSPKSLPALGELVASIEDISLGRATCCQGMQAAMDTNLQICLGLIEDEAFTVDF